MSDANEVQQLNIAETIARRSPAALYAYEFTPFRILYTNQQSHALLGYPRDEVLEWTFSDFLSRVHQDDRESLRRMLAETPDLAPDQTREAEFRMQRADGSMRWLCALESPLQTNASGKTQAILGTIEDITATVMADREIAFHREFENLITDASRRFINSSSDETDEIVRDVLRDISSVMPLRECHLCRVHDRMPEKLSLTHHHSSNQAASVLQGLSYVPVNVMDWFWQKLQQGKPMLIRDTSRLPSDSQLFRSILFRSGIESYLVVPLLVADAPWGFMGFIPERTNRVWQKDTISLLSITGEILLNGIQRGERDRELRLSEERWRSVARTASDQLIIMEEDGTIQYSSDPVTGEEAKDSRGQSIYTQVAPPYRNLLRGQVQSVIVNQRDCDIEYQGTGPNGSEEWFRARLGPHMQNGKMVGLTFLATSIQETKDVEEQLQKLQADFEHAARLGVLGSMSTEIAHQLNQPLQVIESYISGCRNLISRDQMTMEKLNVVMEQISESVQDAGNTIHGICDFVRNRGPHSEECSLNKIVNDALRLSNATIRKYGVVVQQDLAPDLPLIRANAIQITHALLNMMINGIEAMVDGRFDTLMLEVCTRMTSNRAVEVAVIDHGPGIPSDIRDKMFEQFFTTKSTGLGIGLALCRNIVEAHKGRLWVASTGPRGTDFRITLPTLIAEAPPADTQELNLDE